MMIFDSGLLFWGHPVAIHWSTHLFNVFHFTEQIWLLYKSTND